MYKFIYFSLADALLVFCHSVEGQQIALRSLLIIPSFMFLGWHDAAEGWLAVILKSQSQSGLDFISIWRHLIFSLASSSFRNKVQKHAISYHGAASIYSHFCPYLSTAGSFCHQNCTSCCWHAWHGGLSSLSLTFFLFVSSSFISPPCHQSLSPSIPQSGRLSSFLNILKLMYLTQRSALSLSVSHSVCLPSAFPAVFHHLSFWNWFTGCNVAHLVLAEWRSWRTKLDFLLNPCPFSFSAGLSCCDIFLQFL